MNMRHKTSTADDQPLNVAAMIKVLNSEIRAPLSAIISAADMIFQDDTLTRDERKAMAVHVSKTGKGLYTFFSKVIKLGALKSGQHSLQRVDTNLCEVLRSAVYEAGSKTSRPDVRITEWVDDCPSVHIDHEEIKNALVTILCNAIEVSPAGGEVIVKILCECGSVSLSVTDSGPGVDPDILPCLFSGFTEDAKLHRGGRGLDLAIAYELVKQQGGSLTADTSTGTGTTFTLSLPICGQTVLSDATAAASTAE